MRDIPEKVPNAVEEKVGISAKKALSLKKNILWNSVGSFIRIACYWLLTVATIRLSDSYDNAGILALAMSIVNLFSPIADFKLRTYAVTEVTAERSARQYLGIRVITTFFTFFASVIYVVATCDLSLFWILTIYIASQLISTFGDGYHAVHQRAMRMDYIGISYGLQGLLSLASFSACLWIFNSLLFAVTSLVVVSAIITFGYDFPTARSIDVVSLHIDWKDLIQLLLKLTPLVFVSILLNAVGLFPRQYLAMKFGEGSLGIYTAVAAPVIIVQVSASYITYPLLGRMAELFQTNKQLAKKMQKRVILAIFVLAMLCSLLFFLFGEEILSLIFGDSIRPYTYLIQPALLLSFITAIAWYFNDLLFALRDFRGCLLGSAVAALATILLTWCLTPLFELNSPSVVGIFAYLCALTVWGTFYVKDLRELNTK